jgi:hypothetical protein
MMDLQASKNINLWFMACANGSNQPSSLWDVLDAQRISVLGQKRLALAKCGIFSWTVEITLGDGAIG